MVSHAHTDTHTHTHMQRENTKDTKHDKKTLNTTTK